MKFLKTLAVDIALVLPLLIITGCNSGSSTNDNSTSSTESSSGSSGSSPSGSTAPSEPVADTGQSACYNNDSQISCPDAGAAFYGQDAQYASTQMSFRDNGDGTISDLNTGLVWQKDPGDKVSWSTANANARSVALTLAGYSDWRIPTIKELYSLINFNGATGTSESNATPYIDTTYFDFSYGDTSAGERYIDAQFWSNNEYVSTTMNGDATVFGVNFADGRIKGYPRDQGSGGGDNTMFIRYVRGQTGYGVNSFTNNGNGSVTDQTTGLTWQKADDGVTRNWEEALSYCENLDLASATDWRAPNAKELQGIVDYTRSPDTTGSAAIDPVFEVTSFIDGNGVENYGYFWTGTTHLDGARAGKNAIYVAFGEALGYMEQPPGSGNYQLLDVHGAGAQRSDPKSGDPSMYPFGNGPQGDVISIYNYIRCVRG